MSDFTDISKAEALATLQGALDRKEYRVGQAWYGEVVEIKYGTVWLQVARTDKQDDVSTGRYFEGRSVEEMLKFWMEHVHWGARITADSFCCIDALTDG